MIEVTDNLSSSSEWMHLQQSLVFMIWFCISDLFFSEPHIISRRFIWFSMNFSRLDLINFNLQDLNFHLIAFDLIEIDIATNRFARIYETRPTQLFCWSKQRFLRPYCNLLWSFDQLLGSGLICFYYHQFSAYYSFGKVGKYLQILFSGWNLSLTRVHLVLI